MMVDQLDDPDYGGPQRVFDSYSENTADTAVGEGMGHKGACLAGSYYTDLARDGGYIDEDHEWIVPKKNNPAGSLKYRFACPDSPCGELISYITDDDRSTQITYQTFVKYADLEPLREMDHPAMYRISAKDNWAISFHKSVTPSGIPIVYFDWSRIEHVFSDEPIDLSYECELARRAGY